MPENIKRGTFLNFIAYTLSGVFFFAFKIIAAHGLGPEKFGIISVMLATAWVIARFLSTGIKDGATRFIAHHEATNDTGAMLKIFLDCTKFTAIASALFLVIYLVLFSFFTSKLFSGYLSLSLLFIGSCLFYFFLFFLRGVLQGLRELKDNAISIIIEFSVMLISLICFFLIAKDVRLAALALFLAPLCALAFILLTSIKHRKRFSHPLPKNPSTKELLQFIVPTGFINFSSGFMTQLGPPLIRFLGGFSLAGVFTASLDIFKSARTALNALFISIFPHLSRQEALKNRTKLDVMIRNGLLMVSLASVILVAIAATAGQSIVQFVYGKAFAIARIHLIMMAVFTGFFLFSELLNRILLAKSMIRELSISWLIAFLLLVALLFIPLDPLLRVEVAFLGAGFVAFIGMLISLLSKRMRNETASRIPDRQP
jgi:O-antigen/teichoic acid export membrane protein